MSGLPMVPLGSIAKVYDGTHQTPQYVSEGVPFYSVEHLTRNDFSDTKFIAREIYDAEIRRVKIERGDILMTRIGSIGETRLIDWDAEASFYVSLALVKPKPDISSRYLAHAMQGAHFQRELYKRTLHVAFPKKINLGEISECTIPLPEIDEQERIASVLDAWDKAISEAKSSAETHSIRLEWLIDAVLSGKSRLSNFNKSWSRLQLSDVLTEHKLRSSGNEDVFSVSVHRGLVNQIEHLGRSFAAQSTDHYNRVMPGDIVYTKSPTGQFPLGVVKQSTLDEDAIVSPLYGVFRPKSKSLGSLLDALFSVPSFAVRYLTPLVQKGAKNTIAVTNNQFLEGRVMLPSDAEEIDALADLIKTQREIITHSKKLVSLLEDQKRGITQKFIGGKAGVSDRPGFSKTEA
ncbi:restriction endonuclease subunit S [Qipengyuania sp. GH1]|uniref:restriction endonuclease subunit S n=1 Tax=Qipengyuania aestuarii TaxID=2867241 RepID=UPI001C875DD4|nr:restriction endonuclease subunit S [Qipengyuania aestuarii]